MAKKKHKKKKRRGVKCEGKMDAEHIDVPEAQAGMKFDIIEVICFPYILCQKIAQCCMTAAAGTNLCMLCWMCLQWMMCRISNFGTPDLVLFPYYFNIFIQVLIMSAIFAGIWLFFAKPVVIPYFAAVVDTYNRAVITEPPKPNKTKTLRRYCFKKSEIFETTVSNGIDAQSSYLSIYTIGASLCYEYLSSDVL